VRVKRRHWLSVEQLLDVMSAGELGVDVLSAVLQSAVPALEATGGALVGVDELSRALGVVGAASARTTRPSSSSWMAMAPSPSRSSGSWPTCSRSRLGSLGCYTHLPVERVFSLLVCRGIHLY